MRFTKHIIAGAVILAVAGAAAWAFSPKPDAPKRHEYAVMKDGRQIGTYVIPYDSEADTLPNAAEIRLGRRLLDDTAQMLPANVGAKMNCNSCHLSGGKLEFGAPYINTARNYPSFNPRAGREVSLEDRINGCFLRSMNGKPLGKESTEMKAMIAYMTWLSADLPEGAKVKIASVPTIDKSLVPNPENGRAIYAAQCASCHGANGEGMQDASGNILFPPLWGEHSFNIGAGLARTNTAAVFVKGNMPVSMHYGKPLGQGKTLSDQEALDVAEFFSHMPRPDFAGKVNDWPNGKKPPDARY